MRKGNINSMNSLFLANSTIDLLSGQLNYMLTSLFTNFRNFSLC